MNRVWVARTRRIVRRPEAPLLLLVACSPSPSTTLFAAGSAPPAHRSAGPTTPPAPGDRDNDGHARPSDCNDLNPAVHPGAAESCNGVDDDCDRQVDDNAADAPTWYLDGDADGWGTTVSTRRACAAPAGYAANVGDCDDGDAASSPGATEVCNDADDDCDTLVDDADPSLDPASATAWHPDADGDGWGDAEPGVTACEAPAGWVADGTDCLDADATVFPDATGACAVCPEGFEEQAGRCVLDWTADYEALTAGVTRIGTGSGYGSLLVVHGDGAFPLFLDGDHRAFAAAARHGDGRVLHVGHEGMLSPGSAQARTFLRNTVAWAGGASRPTVGVAAGLDSLAGWLLREGYPVVTVDDDDVEGGALDAVDVYVTTSYAERSDAAFATIRAWIEAGGGYVSGGHAWYWAYTHDDPTNDYPGNQILNAAGITVTGSYDVASSSVAVPTSEPDRLAHAGLALDAIVAHFDGSAPLSDPEAAMASGTVSDALANLPVTFDAWYGPVLDLVGEVDAVVPSVTDPVLPGAEPLDAVVVLMAYAFAAGLPANELFALPSEFPGDVDPSAPRRDWRVEIEASYEGRDSEYWYAGSGEPVWRATGLYVPPGEVVTVGLPAGWEGQGLTALVGAHTDWIGGLDTWQRHPGISRSWALDGAVTEVGSAFGGPLYVRVPAGLALGVGEVEVSGAVAMPTYRHGVTDPATFLADVAAAEVPLVELASDSFALVLVREELPADLDPSALMDLYEAVLDADADLAAIDQDRVRAERLSMDVQISAGWMHSGYPIMAYQYTSVLADAATMSTTGDWGVFHEIGHNHQYGPTNLPGTTECTTNLWSVYAMETVVGVDRGDAHPALSAASREATIAAYVSGGRDYWGAWNTWTCLETYLQLQEAFGWAPIQALHATYLAMPTGDRPDTDQERIDRWALESSLAVGYDLTAFYEAWGFPLSAETYAAVATLPAWEEHPMVGR